MTKYKKVENGKRTLRLNRETVRLLTLRLDDLKRVAGGFVSGSDSCNVISGPTGPGGCDP